MIFSLRLSFEARDLVAAQQYAAALQRVLPRWVVADEVAEVRDPRSVEGWGDGGTDADDDGA